MDEGCTTPDPILTPTTQGWLACGEGWAVHGRTEAEALQRYHAAVARHGEIDQRPFWSARMRDEGMPEETREASP